MRTESGKKIAIIFIAVSLFFLLEPVYDDKENRTRGEDGEVGGGSSRGRVGFITGSGGPPGVLEDPSSPPHSSAIYREGGQTCSVRNVLCGVETPSPLLTSPL